MQKGRTAEKMIVAYDPLKDPNYLSMEMISYFKEKLENMRQRILSKEDVMNISMPMPNNREIDIVDQGATEDLHYGDRSLQKHEDNARQEIENALQRIKDGTYGYCEATGEPIGVKRLILVPTARYSIKIQEKVERDNKW